MKKIAIIGGTGPEGRGLGLRFAIAGHNVIIGSRTQERAEQAALEISSITPDLNITGSNNEDAANSSDVVILSVPFEGLRPVAETIEPLTKGKLIVSIIAPLSFSEGHMKALNVPEGSAGELTSILFPQSLVASAFQNLSARDLLNPSLKLNGDVAICSNSDTGLNEVVGLVSDIPDLRPLNAGSLSNSRYVEELTALLINMNKIHKTHTTIQFLGI
tara:strand:- start:1999 stop:2649 length:651 start_codon:yes stop_codon:yes gene_type:complete